MGEVMTVDNGDTIPLKAAGAFAAAEAAMSAIPIIGPVLVSALGEYRTEKRFRRLEHFAETFGTRLDAIHDSYLDADYLRSAEYVDYVIRAAELAAQSHRVAKVELLAAVAAGAAAVDATDVLRDKFLGTADRLGSEHIEALREFRDGELWLRERDDVKEIRLPSPELRERFSTEILDALIRDLVREGLVQDVGAGRWSVTAGQVWRLTATGRLFLNWLEKTRYGDVHG